MYGEMPREEGSICGPIMWDMIMNDLLQKRRLHGRLQPGRRLVIYANSERIKFVGQLNYTVE